MEFDGLHSVLVRVCVTTLLVAFANNGVRITLILPNPIAVNFAGKQLNSSLVKPVRSGNLTVIGGQSLFITMGNIHVQLSSSLTKNRC